MRIDRAKFAAELVRANLNVNGIAEKAGLSRGTITAIRGGKACSKRTAEKIAFGLGVPIEAILQNQGKA